MSRTILNFIILFIILVLVQVIVCNRICLFNIAVPIVFIYFIIRLPVSLGVNWVMTLSFTLGLTIDIFSNTQGMNALACTLIGALRKPILHLYLPRDDDMGNPVPSSKSLGMGVYMKYLSSMVVLYCIFIFIIQSFTLFNFQLMMLRIAGSSILTFILLLGFDSIANTRREKRL